MGKKLIVKDADFSENGISSYTDISYLFDTWTSGALNANGNIASSAVFHVSDSVDISQYAGKKMKFTNAAYKTATGNQPEYFTYFYDSNGDSITGTRIRVQAAPEAAKGTGYTVEEEVTLPSNVSTVRFTYFDEDGTASFAFDAFSCSVNL